MPWKISSPISTVPRITHSSWMRPANSSILLLMFLAWAQKYLNCFCLVLSEFSAEEVPSAGWLEGLPDVGFWQGKALPFLAALCSSFLGCPAPTGMVIPCFICIAGGVQPRPRKEMLTKTDQGQSAGNITTNLSSS